MATWQFDCLLVPRDTWHCNPGDPSTLFQEGAAPFWSAWSGPAVRRELQGLGPPTPTWTNSIVLWGEEDKTCVSLDLEGDVVEDLRVRVDMRQPKTDLLMALLAIAQRQGWLLITENREVLEPDAGAIARAAEASDAARFAADPRTFLAELHMRQFLKVLYLGGRRCTRITMDGARSRLELHVNVVSRVDEPRGDLSTDEDIVDGVLVFADVAAMALAPRAPIPDDYIEGVVLVDSRSRSGGAAKWTFLICLGAVDKQARSTAVTLTVEADDFYIEDPRAPGVPVRWGESWGIDAT
jgi:hypothetical protein